jgi:class 3 adenylate cyclase
MLQAAAEWGQEFASPMEQAMLAIYQANQEHTWTENLLGEVEDALDRAGLWSKVATTPAICFLDLTGYTRLTEERGDRARRSWWRVSRPWSSARRSATGARS